MLFLKVPSRLSVSRLSHLPPNSLSHILTMSFALAHNRPLEIMHLYFDDKQEVMATCLLATNETVELVSVVSISDRRVILRAFAHELLWSVIRTVYFLEVLPVIWHHIIQTIRTVVRGPVNMNARQARDDFADAVADTSHISVQSDRAMSHFLATISSPLSRASVIAITREMGGVAAGIAR
ncbi:hypothetical protein MVLG_00854 [Microbotryum lychnidis-dioicae p1A1 Lamole]|uniref:Uncharacterized protein n=1 Tax=Microbotryum lychnidis-dioicae (strain p1A1 Lamole / MvSl-1064) TaxID=683840 RepID=U5H0B8_USTV1|nr:hypothetical protein MVLG_00854 [Microbotryum lychnidis-dioicae p1A1 Lamole]|eukprot:KDE09140.1 hypothetical protein MVLG_00854 [Microbotryum lychnidis-dioicae p1A1 Lamole]